MLLNAKTLTVLIVAHNAAPTLSTAVEQVFRALTLTVEDFAIVIFDDGSTDDTPALAQAAAERFPFVRIHRNARRMGFGYCSVEGSKQADTTYVACVSADAAHPARAYVELFGNVGRADVVTSYSAVPGQERPADRAYRSVLNRLFKRRLRNYNGLTIYPAEHLRRVSIRSFGPGFAAEALLKALATGYSFTEIALPGEGSEAPAAEAAGSFRAIPRLLADYHELRRRKELVARPASPSHEKRTLRIVIAGASSGIGARLAQALASDGHRLVICARRADRLASVAAASPAIDAQPCDVSDERQVERFAAHAAAKLGAVDVLINCAGVIGEIGPIASVDSAAWWGTMETNLKGAYLLARHMLPLLAKGQQARIINFSGGGAFNAFPNYSAYACSKAAIVRLTECLAEELAGSNIRVNAIAPGPIPTEMHQATLDAGEERAGRLQYHRTRAVLQQSGASMDNVAACIRKLISPELDALTGKTISANFDPWQTAAFQERLPEIVNSDLYTLRRVNLVHLPEGRLRSALSESWTNKTER